MTEHRIATQEEWEAAQAQIAQHEQLLAAQEAEAEATLREWELADAQQALAEGDPEAVQRLHELAMRGVEERLAPLQQWMQGLAAEMGNAEGERLARAQVDVEIERLGPEGLSHGAVWERSNEYLSAAQAEAKAEGLSREKSAVLYSPEAARMAIELAAPKCGPGSDA